ncbi:MAG TPA: hypothetical protein VN666_21995 [Nitrospira sp.]|nr:hypothetical protein [Nitrospira sp.]
MTANRVGQGWERRSDDQRFGDIERDMAVLQKTVSDHSQWVEESKEFHKQMSNFVASFKAVETERDKQQSLRHQENQDKLDNLNSRIGISNLIIAALGLIVAIAMLYIGYQAGAHHAKLDPTHLFTSDPTIAERQDNAQANHWRLRRSESAAMPAYTRNPHSR